MKRKRVSLHY